MANNPINRSVYTDRYNNNGNVRDSGINDLESLLDGADLDYETDLEQPPSKNIGGGFESPRSERSNSNQSAAHDALDEMDDDSLVRAGRELSDRDVEEDDDRPFKTIVSDLKKQIENSTLDREEKNHLRQEAAALLRTGKITPQALKKLEDLREAVQGALEKQQEELDAQNQQALSLISSLKDDIENSGFSEVKKEEFTDSLTQIQNDLRRKKITPQKATEQLNAFKKTFKKAETEGRIRADVERLPGLVPRKGWASDRSQRLASYFKDAVISGNWSEFREWCMVQFDNDFNNMVQQFVGTLFFKVCDEDENRLNQILDLIPKDIRQDIIAKVGNLDRELHSTENLESESQREDFAYYGTPFVTQQRLIESIRWSNTPETERASITSNRGPGANPSANSGATTPSTNSSSGSSNRSGS